METPMIGMSASFMQLSLATAAFVVSHFVLSWGPVRRRLVGLAGENAFLIGYSVIAIATFVWMCLAYAWAPFEDIWGDPYWMRWVSVALMPLATILFAGGVATTNPGAVGQTRLAGAAPMPHGVQKVTRHPMMMAVAIWSALHLGTNGDMASLILFGGILVLALGGIAHLEMRRRADDDGSWAKFAAASSVLPFVALAQGRARMRIGEIGWNRIAAGILLYLVLLFGHRVVIDAPILPGLFAP
jgi:uncharacterized membrane protein